MDNYTIFTKTAKGLSEALGKTKALSRESRKILKEVDGKVSLAEIIDKLDDIAEAKIQVAMAKMLADDFVREFGTTAPPEAKPKTMGDSIFGNTTSFSALENAHSQLTIGDFMRAMEAAGDGAVEGDGSLSFKTMIGQPIAEPEVDTVQKARTEEVLRKAQVAREQAEQAARQKREVEAQRLQQELAAKVSQEAAPPQQSDALARQEAASVARKKAEADAKAQQEAEAKAQLDAEQQTRRIAQERARQDSAVLSGLTPEPSSTQAEIVARQEAAATARRAAEAEAKAKKEAEQKAQHEAQERMRKEAAEQARIQAQQQAEQQARQAEEARRAAEAKAKQEAEEQARREAEALAKQRAEEEAMRAAQERALQLAAEQARQEAEARAKREAEEAARRAAEERARKEAEEQARQKAWEAARLAAEAQAKKEAEAKAKREAEEAARRAAEEQARIKAEEKARKAAEEKARKEAEAQAKKEAKERARKEAEEQARIKAEEKAKRDAEEQQRKEIEAAARREAEAKAKQEAEEQARIKAEEKAKRDAEEQARKETETRARQEADERARAEKEEKARLKAEEDARKETDKQEQEARKEAEKQAKDAEKAMARAAAGPRLALQPAKLVKLGVLGLALLAVVGVGSLQFKSYDDRIPQVQQTASAQFGHPVKINSMRLSLLPTPTWRLEGITVGDAGQINAQKLEAPAGIGSLFGGAATFESVRLVEPVVNEEGLGWLLFGRAGQPGFGLRQFSAVQATLKSERITLPAFDLSASVGADGNWQKAVLDASEGKWHVALQSSGNIVQVELSADTFIPPFGGKLVLEKLNASGSLTRGELALNDIKAIAYDGVVGGNARLGWADGWNLSGELTVRQLDLVKLAPGVFQSGTVDGNMKYTLQAAQAGQLLASPQGRGSFSTGSGALAGVDLAGMLLGEGGNKTAFTSLTGDYVLSDGKLQLRRMQLGAGVLSASGSADVNLAGEGKLSGRFALDLKTSVRQARGNVNLGGTLTAAQFSR